MADRVLASTSAYHAKGPGFESSWDWILIEVGDKTPPKY